MELQPYELLKNSKLDVLSILCDTFGDCFKTVKRRMVTRRTIRNSRKLNIRISIHRLIFLQWYQALRNYVPAFGHEIDVKRDKKGIIKNINISFNHIRTFKFHMQKVLKPEVDIEIYLRKKNPAVISYNFFFP